MPDSPDTELMTEPVPAPRAGPQPHAWREAFAALEMEVPTGDGWPRLAAMLPMAASTEAAVPPTTPANGPRAATRGRQRRRRLAWAAAAAALGVVALIPLKLLDVSTTVPSTAPPIAAASPSRPPAAATRPVADTTAVDTPRLREDADVPSMTGTDRPHATAALQRTVAATAHARSPARAAPKRDHGPAGASRLARDSQSLPTGDAFDRLYGESARLEAMVAMVRDDGMSSATAASMTAAIDARIGGIDASLSQPELLPDARLQLWQARVQALRDLAGLGATQRLMAAQGQDYDTTLVRVD